MSFGVEGFVAIVAAIVVVIVAGCNHSRSVCNRLSFLRLLLLGLTGLPPRCDLLQLTLRVLFFTLQPIVLLLRKYIFFQE